MDYKKDFRMIEHIFNRTNDGDNEICCKYYVCINCGLNKSSCKKRENSHDFYFVAADRYVDFFNL